MRAIEGELYDSAGNLTEVREDLYPELSPWPQVELDATPPGLAITPHVQRCDGYEPAEIAANHLLSPESWQMDECAESFFHGSCESLELSQEPILYPLRMTFFLDEAIAYESASVTLQNGGQSLSATIDPCLSSADEVTTRVVAALDPSGANEGVYEVILTLSDLAGTPATLSAGTIEIDNTPDGDLRVDEPGMVTSTGSPGGTDTMPMNSAQVTGLASAGPKGVQILVYDGPDPETAQLLNQGEVLGTTAEDDGSFDIPLTPGDRANVYIQARIWPGTEAR